MKCNFSLNLDSVLQALRIGLLQSREHMLKNFENTTFLAVPSAQTGWWIECQIHPYLQQNMEANRLTQVGKRFLLNKPKNSQERTFLFCLPIPPQHQASNFSVHHTWNLPCLSQTLTRTAGKELEGCHNLTNLFPNGSGFLCCWHKASYWRERGPILMKQMYRHGTGPRISVPVLLNKVLNGGHVPSLSALQGLMIS